jgi:glycosyltransferase involved in cell wall biosynthesis
MPMKLSFILTPGLVSSLYRVIFPMRALEKRGHTVVWPADWERDVPMRELTSCDLVHCFRRDDRNADLKALAEHGVAVSVDNDDDLGELDVVPGLSRHHARKEYARVASRLAAQARQADLVTTPSPVIAKKYRNTGASNVVVIENYLEPDRGHFGANAGHRGVSVGWVAAREHQPDVSTLEIAKVLARLLREHDDLEVLTVDLKLNLPSERYRHVEFVQHHELIATASCIDIGIAPLVDNAFNRARSNVKLKEYAAAGAAWLASPVAPYIGLGERQGGMLVEDDDWFDAISQLLRDARKRRRLSRRALRWAKSQTIDRHVTAWEREFERAIALAAERGRHMSLPMA